MKVAICDDDLIFLNAFARQVQTISGVEDVETYSDYEVFLEDLSADYDLVFMDIDWEKEKNGIDIAAQIREQYVGAKIIYVTSYVDKYIEEVFLQKTNIRGILNKPVKTEVLETYIGRIEKELEEDQKEILQVKENNRRITIPTSEIKYLESQNHMIKIFTTRTEYHIYETLEKVLGKLPADFCRCHRGFVVNMSFICEMQKKEVTLRDCAPIPVGRHYRDELEKRYIEYLKRMI